MAPGGVCGLPGVGLFLLSPLVAGRMGVQCLWAEAVAHAQILSCSPLAGGSCASLGALGAVGPVEAQPELILRAAAGFGFLGDAFFSLSLVSLSLDPRELNSRVTLTWLRFP